MADLARKNRAIGGWKDYIPSGAWPRLLPGGMAAAYMGRSLNAFMAAVRAGAYPKPVESHPARWDREALDTVITCGSAALRPNDAEAAWLARIGEDAGQA